MKPPAGKCKVAHRKYEVMAKCLWPRAVWVTGDGKYALVAYCGQVSVTLWGTHPKALSEMEGLRLCGHACTGNHRVIDMEARHG